jgi:hypothetical protein
LGRVVERRRRQIETRVEIDPHEPMQSRGSFFALKEDETPRPNAPVDRVWTRCDACCEERSCRLVHDGTDSPLYHCDACRD